MATQRVTTTVTVRRRKTGGNSGYIKCNVCGGTGRQRKPYSKKKSSGGKSRHR